MATQKYIQKGTKRRSGQKLLGVKFIVEHDTGNIDTTAMNNVDYFIKSANEMEASAHVFIDDVDVIECIPLDEKAWHVRYGVDIDNSIYGVDANDSALGIELCFFSDVERTKKAYNNYVQYIKELSAKYKLPKTSHIAHATLDPTRRSDPHTAFKTIGKTWEQFLVDLYPISAPPVVPPDNEKVKEVERLLDWAQRILKTI